MRLLLAQVLRAPVRYKFFPAASIGCLLWTANVFGGPPLLTDDPDTPGPNHWEINVATTSEEASHQWAFGIPLLDMNYGVGDHIQLSYQGQLNVLSPEHGSVVAGMGNSLAGVKWRFLDQTNSCWLEVSTYPQLEFVYPASSYRRGLADNGDNLLLPIEVEHTFQKLTVYSEAGYILNQYQTAEAWAGMAGEYDLTEKFTAMFELYGGFDGDFENGGLSFNFGFRRPVTGHVALIGSAGRGIFGPPLRAPAFQSYLALQLTF